MTQPPTAENLGQAPLLPLSHKMSAQLLQVYLGHLETTGNMTGAIYCLLRKVDMQYIILAPMHQNYLFNLYYTNTLLRYHQNVFLINLQSMTENMLVLYQNIGSNVSA